MATLQEEISRRRTFAIISHPDAGKTTLTEKFLLYGGAIAQAGEVKGKRERAAKSDWMEIEKQRGISVTSSVMQFQHGGYCINILDTPGHQDFSEDTYRTLMAADSAVMVIDGAKGVEPQTRKLFKVCALRNIPIFTFINKMDRETRDPLELCEEVERELGIDTYPVNWPIGCGKEFAGVYDRDKRCILHFTDAGHAKKAGITEIELDDPALVDLIGQAHRDRLAFMRICSGRFERDTEYFHVQSGRKMRLSQPQTMMAAEREIVDEAYAGDIIGVFDPGIFSIGDTITMPGKKFRFSGIPTFEPEHFMLVSPKDTMKRKQFVKGVEQIAQEGAIQIFKIPDSGFEDVVVGVVGTLQFDVFEYRMKNEYGVDLRMSGLPYEHLRLIRECPCDVKDLMLCSGSRVLEDFKGRKLIAFGGEWSVGFLTKHNEGLILDDWLSV